MAGAFFFYGQEEKKGKKKKMRLAAREREQDLSGSATTWGETWDG